MDLSCIMRNILLFIYSVMRVTQCQFLPPGDNAASLDETPVTLIYTQGNTAVLPCQIQNQGDMDVSWFKENYQIIASGNVIVNGDKRISVETKEPGDWNLVIKNVQEEDAKLYICMLQSFPPQEKKFTVHVNTKPKIDKDSLLERYLFKKGEALNITCNVSGYPEPSVKWYAFRTELSTMKEIKELVSSTQMLMFKNLGPSDGGIYGCEAENVVGTDMYEIFLQEVYEPKLSTTKNKFVEKESSVIVLQCEIESNPAADIGWQRNGKLLKTDMDKYSIEVYTEGDFKTVTELTIRDINTLDRGEYQCLARNTIGIDYIKFNVIVEVSTTTVKITTRKPTTARLTTEPVPIPEKTTATSTVPTKTQPDNLKKTTTAINYVEGPKTGDSRSHASLVTYSYMYTILLTVFSITLLLVL